MFVLNANLWASLVAQLVKNLPAMRETWVRSLGQEDTVEKGKATQSSILAWRIPWDRKEPDRTERFSLSVEFQGFYSFLSAYLSKEGFVL